MAAKNKFLNAMKMPSIDDMFSSEADRQRESGDLVTYEMRAGMWRKPPLPVIPRPTTATTTSIRTAA